MKIDVEGAELNVLSGFKAMLRKQSIGFIQFEYGKTTALAGGSLRGLFDVLSSSHVFLRVMPEGYLLVDESRLDQLEDYRWANYIAVSRSRESSFLNYLREGSAMRS